MKEYYINKNTDSNGRNEVHTSNCFWLSLVSNRAYLGSFANGNDAVSYAKRIGYPYADGCKHCSPEAHTA